MTVRITPLRAVTVMAVQKNVRQRSLKVTIVHGL